MQDAEEQVKVEFLGARLSDAGYTGVKGDIRTVPKSLAEKWCAAGWAADVSGGIKTGERNTRPVKINPKKMVQANDSQEVK